jgi:hypothetical protein
MPPYFPKSDPVIIFITRHPGISVEICVNLHRNKPDIYTNIIRLLSASLIRNLRPNETAGALYHVESK